MSREPVPVRYLCLDRDCSHEFDAGPGPTTCPACGHVYVGRLSWYVVHVNSSADAAVADRLRAMGHLVLFLHYRVTIRPQNRPRQVLRPVMPGYVFVGLVPEPDFYEIATLPGVAAVLANDKGPAALDAQEIDRLRAWADSGGRVALGEDAAVPRPRLDPGTVVRIRRGSFEGFERTVERDDGKLIRVMASMFGREVPLDLAYEDIEVLVSAV